jgi:hypothetical protein
MPSKNSYGEIVFNDFPEFKPNLTPREMFKLGSFGGTYWRPIYSSVTDRKYKDIHLKYPKSWWKGIPNNYLTSDECDNNINKYKAISGTSLEYWEDKKWINKLHPYGWVHWYCDFYSGKRSIDDERQINRWKNFTGPNGRFRVRLINMIKKKNTEYNDYLISPVIRQGLQHWAYKLTKKDFDKK